MSERAQALEQWKLAALLKDRTRREIRRRVRTGELALLVAEDFGVPVQFVEVVASWQMFEDEPLAAPPVGVSPQPDTRRDCTCLGTCRGAEGLGPRWKCALEKSASLSPVEPTPDAQVCVWREREWDYESGCRGTQISRDERSSGPPDGWKHCPYCGKRLEVGTAPQGGTTT